MRDQFAYTGATPAAGYVGFVNLKLVDGGLQFSVRSEGENPPSAAYVVPLAEAATMLCDVLEAMPDPPRHDYWRPGEADCPREIKAGNGELHTRRCKRCGLDSPRDKICRPPKMTPAT